MIKVSQLDCAILEYYIHLLTYRNGGKLIIEDVWDGTVDDRFDIGLFMEYDFENKTVTFYSKEI